MRCLVTGAAGFVGSHLTEALLDAGHEVVGVDAFTPYYPVEQKRRNVARALAAPSFRLVEADLSRDSLDDAIAGAEVVFHLAAQPGVRTSWADFPSYERHNLGATALLLEAVMRQPRQPRLVYASSSSVYGDSDDVMRPGSPTLPFSPYGVTKLAAEHLVLAYTYNFGLASTSLRFFTVYGPRQRPDMAFAKFIAAARADEPIPVYGDGEQVRDYTFVADVVAALVAAATAPTRPGAIYNVAGGSNASVLDVAKYLGDILGREVRLDFQPVVAGDVRRTSADISATVRDLGWRPSVSVDQGLAAQVAWTLGDA
jgi:UDP-glucuronate 4-epimerase